MQVTITERHESPLKLDTTPFKDARDDPLKGALDNPLFTSMDSSSEQVGLDSCSQSCSQPAALQLREHLALKNGACRRQRRPLRRVARRTAQLRGVAG